MDALEAAVGTLLEDPAALERARDGALRARETLTWDAAAEAHLALYRELVDLQLYLFAADDAGLLAEADEAEAAWVRSGRDEAEESYGDFQLVVDAIADRLLELREGYATTLDEEATEEYRRAFHRAVARRFRRYPSLVADLEP